MNIRYLSLIILFASWLSLRALPCQLSNGLPEDILPIVYRTDLHPYWFGGIRLELGESCTLELGHEGARMDGPIALTALLNRPGSYTVTNIAANVFNPGYISGNWGQIAVYS